MTGVGLHIHERIELSKLVKEKLVLIWKNETGPCFKPQTKSKPDEDLNMKYKTINFQKKAELSILMTLEYGKIS